MTTLQTWVQIPLRYIFIEVGTVSLSMFLYTRDVPRLCSTAVLQRDFRVGVSAVGDEQSEVCVFLDF